MISLSLLDGLRQLDTRAKTALDRAAFVSGALSIIKDATIEGRPEAHDMLVQLAADIENHSLIMVGDLFEFKVAVRLDRRGISTLAKLCRLSPFDLRLTNGIGPRTLEAIRRRLQGLGLRLQASCACGNIDRNRWCKPWCDGGK